METNLEDLFNPGFTFTFSFHDCPVFTGEAYVMVVSSAVEPRNMEDKQTKKSFNADTNVEELAKKNEKLTEAVEKLKTFIKSSNEDFERKDEDIRKKEGEIEKLERENQKLKEKLWASKLKIKDFIQKLHDKDAQVAETDDKIEELQNEIKGLQGKKDSTSMDFDNSEAFFESDDDDDLEILATPPKLFEEVTLDEDEDANDVITENYSKPSIVSTPSPCQDKGSNNQTENAEIAISAILSPRKSGERDANVNIDAASRISSSVPENILKREKVVKGIQEALAIRQSTATDQNCQLPKKSSKDLLNIGKKIEKCLFRQFEDVGKKYLVKYRSIVQNIRNPQNQVLFRQILQSKISARELVAMNTSDYAKVGQTFTF